MIIQLVDLPCITESHKTVDNKSFYKTADISQVSGSSLNESLYIEYYCWFQQHFILKKAAFDNYRPLS